MRHNPRMHRLLAALLLALGAAGCAAAPDAAGTRAVRAFATLCAPLDEPAIAARAAEYAFAPVDAKARGSALPAALRRDGIRSWVRQGGAVRALLVWNGTTGSCELAVGGIDTDEAEREFAALAASFARSGQSVTPIAIPVAKRNTLALRRSVMIGPPPLLPGALRVLSLRVDDRPDQAIQAVLTLRGVGMERVPTDDAVPVE